MKLSLIAPSRYFRSPDPSTYGTARSFSQDSRSLDVDTPSRDRRIRHSQKQGAQVIEPPASRIGQVVRITHFCLPTPRNSWPVVSSILLNSGRVLSVAADSFS